MSFVVVIGAGLSGCTVACKLADRDVSVILIEKTDRIGGKVRSYGCKAVAGKCQNCGVCLTAGLWDRVSNHKNIRLINNAVIRDITGKPGDFTVNITSGKEVIGFEEVHAVVVCTGFESLPGGISSHLHIENTGDFQGVLTGTQLEKLLLGRTLTGLFENEPKSVAFVQCLGSRDINEGGLYCSKVCCSYSTRTAKLILDYYPGCKITFFYMELQNVKLGDYYTDLQKAGIDFIKCRPLKITCGKPVLVEYEVPPEGIRDKAFDIVILSDGIHAGADNGRLAEVCGLIRDNDGFLQAAGTGSGVYVTGCAKAPKKIDETYADSLATAGKILNSLSAI